jgi:hypothetical protein
MAALADWFSSAGTAPALTWTTSTANPGVASAAVRA